MTLFGTVPSQQSKQAAASEVRKVRGVRDVKNDLQVVAEAKAERIAAEDDDVRSAVEKRLEARGDLAGSDIDVEVSDGVARLTGSVDSQVDRCHFGPFSDLLSPIESSGRSSRRCRRSFDKPNRALR